ncbi:MAG: hypothetical protein WCK43_02365 [bacterium]
MHSALKKGLSWTLSYGIAFSLPGWALLSRVAHAGIVSADEKSPNPKPPAPKKKVAAPTDVSHKNDNELESAPPEGKGKGEGKEGKGESAPRTKDCSDKKMIQTSTFGQPNDLGPRCDTINTNLNSKCWHQLFELLGAARTNALITNNSLEASQAAQQAAAWTSAEGNIIKTNLFPTSKNKSIGPSEDELKSVFARMSDESIQNKKQCCQQLVNQAEQLSNWILSKSKEEKDSKVNSDQVKNLIQTQRAACDQKQNVAAAGAAVVAAPPVAHAQQAPEKKKSIWPAVFWGLAAGALLFFLLYKRKKRNSNPPPTPPTPPTPTTTAGSLTYPTLTTATTGRDTTTGGTTGGTTSATTYPSDITGTSTGREILTGGSGTVTGSTTATTATSTTTTTGSTTASPIYPDLSTGNVPRNTDGTVRSISK